MLQRTVEAALAAFKLPQLNQDTVTQLLKKKKKKKKRRKYHSINKASMINTSKQPVRKLAKVYIFVSSIESQSTKNS